MKNTLLLLTLLSLNLLNARDTLKLNIDNPEPRVGDEVELSFSIDFFGEDFQNQLGDEVIVSNNSIYGGMADNFTRIVEFTKVGKQTIGPFTFDFNGRTIITDSITLDVAEELPFEEGAWLRIINDQQGNKYLIIEQLTKDKPTNSGHPYNGGNEESIFCELADFNEKDLKFSFMQSKSNNRSREKDDFFTPGLTYSFMKYKIKLADNFNRTFILKKKHFKNLPNRVHFTDLRIKR